MDTKINRIWEVAHDNSYFNKMITRYYSDSLMSAEAHLNERASLLNRLASPIVSLYGLLFGMEVASTHLPKRKPCSTPT